MSDQQLSSADASVPSRPDAGRARGFLLRVLVLLLAGLVTGAAAGLVWQWVWTPPTGAAWQGEFYLDPTGVRREVTATGWFTVIGLLVGIAVGSVAAYLSPTRELATLVGVLLGSLLLAWTMLVVGHLTGPPDPHEVARTAGDWEAIVSDLRLAGVENVWRPYGSSALLAPAVGALIGLVGIFLGGAGRRARTRPGPTAPTSVG